MIILEIRLNGELLYKVGGSDLTRSSILINAWGFLGEDSKDLNIAQASIEAFGATATKTHSGEVRKWKRKPLRINDEIQIHLVESTEINPPIDVQPLGCHDSEFEHAQFKHAKELYFRLKDKYENMG